MGNKKTRKNQSRHAYYKRNIPEYRKQALVQSWAKTQAKTQRQKAQAQIQVQTPAPAQTQTSAQAQAQTSVQAQVQTEIVGSRIINISQLQKYINQLSTHKMKCQGNVVLQGEVRNGLASVFSSCCMECGEEIVLLHNSKGAITAISFQFKQQ